MFTEFAPTRRAALDRLAGFLPSAGRAYGTRRNFDLPDAVSVSGLSPWIRHRVLTEPEIARAILAQHSPQAADKFLQELCWRAYWKGWLERRPSVWTNYRRGVEAGLNRIATESGLRADWEAACMGNTGIDGFDDWARELVATGYLHNHARMWFASIWIFTLRLPWELGADFFLRHLLDGDPASNTLSWRWVAGIHTVGKTYLARSANIAAFTGGRYRPEGLAAEAPPLRDRPHPAPRPAPVTQHWDPCARTGLLLTEDDLSPAFLFDAGLRPQATALLRATEDRSPLQVSPRVTDWVGAAMTDCTTQWVDRLGWQSPVHAGEPGLLFLRDWALSEGLTQVVTAYAPVGPVAEHLNLLERLLTPQGVRLVRVLREWDATGWKSATHGFFQFRDVIPHLLAPLMPETPRGGNGTGAIGGRSRAK